MFQKNLFLAKLKEKSLTQEDAAKIIGVASTTLYRKMIGHSDFIRNEIQLFRSELGLTAAEVDEIFSSKTCIYVNSAAYKSACGGSTDRFTQICLLSSHAECRLMF